MRHAELLEENCAIARASAVLGERWVWPILRSAFTGARRFEDYQRGTSVARNILSDRLAGLVEHGILDKVLPEGAAQGHREYRLTGKGRALFPVYLALMQWGNEWTGLAAPPVDVLHVPCGHRTTPTVVCSECGQALAARDTRPLLGAGAQARKLRPDSADVPASVRPLPPGSGRRPSGDSGVTGAEVSG